MPIFRTPDDGQNSRRWSGFSVFKIITIRTFQSVEFIRVRVSGAAQKDVSPVKSVALRANIWFWQWQAKAGYYRASARLFGAIIRYHLLCFLYFGWRRIAIYCLEAPKHLAAIGLTLFTHDGHLPGSAITPPVGRPRHTNSAARRDPDPS